MGSNSASNGGGGRTDAGPKRTTATKIGVGNINEKGQKTKTTFTKADDNRDNNKVVAPKKKIDFKPVTKEVLNPNNNIQEKKKTPIIIPKDNNGGGNDGGNQVVQAPVVPVIPKVIAPTESEVSQATATDTTADATEDTIETRKKKTKAKGRSATILSSARGVRSDEGLTLGKRSLLGS